MKLLALGSLLCALVIMAACAAPDPTIPVPAATPPPAATTSAGGSDRSQEEVIDLYPSAADSSIHADVGDRVIVQVNVSGHSGCKDLKVRDPFGNAAIELAPKEIRGGGVQFQGAFFAAADGEYTVELGPESENLRCGGRSSPASAEVKWTVQPR